MRHRSPKSPPIPALPRPIVARIFPAQTTISEPTIEDLRRQEARLNQIAAKLAARLEREQQAKESRSAYFAALRNGTLPPSLGDPGCCQTCAGLGFVHYDVVVGHAQFGKPQACPDCGEQQAKARARTRWKAVSFPAEYESCTLTSYAALSQLSTRQKMALVAVRRWVESIVQGIQSHAMPDHNWLMLSGLVGVGKTGLAISALREVTNAMETGGAYLELSSFLRRCRETFSEIQRSEKEAEYHRGPDALISEYANAPILVIDDLGASRFTAWSLQDVFYPIIVTRHEQNLPTVFTSNLSFQGLVEWIAKTENCFEAGITATRFIDRLGQHCGGENILTFGEDCQNLRRRKKEVSA